MSNDTIISSSRINYISDNNDNKMSYIIVSGGTVSGIGKGIIASSTGLIMKSLGFNVTLIKIDPYLNIDAGTMSPFEHGEVYVLNDGGEVDLDLGNYERFVGITLSRDNNITTGKIYNNVIRKERRGDYLGKTVQVIPHVVDEIQNWIERVSVKPTSFDKLSNTPEVCVIELGGTVGDIESGPFIEALRQLQFRVGVQNVVNIHVALVPTLGGETCGEQKTKPIQQSVKTLRACGLFPDVIMCRSKDVIRPEPKKKIAQFCHVDEDSVISCPDVSNLYCVPLKLVEQRFDYLILNRLKRLPKCTPCWFTWEYLSETASALQRSPDNKKIKISIVGKYTESSDAYLSIVKSLEHASVAMSTPIHINWVESTSLEELGSTEATSTPNKKMIDALFDSDGILVPGGFGDRGIIGKINAINYARTRRIPFLGICLGMQVAVIEYCRNVLNIADATSEEFDPNGAHKVIACLPEINKEHMGGTMRLGSRRTYFSEKHKNTSKTHTMYKDYANIFNENLRDSPAVTVELDEDGDVEYIQERHRHRYEVNAEYVDRLEAMGMKFVGTDKEKKRMEILELDGYLFFVGVQYHPEYQSRLQCPNPIFVGFIEHAALYAAS